MAPPARFRRAPGWVWRRVSAGVLVMGPDEHAHQLTGAAALAWTCLEQAQDVPEVLARGADGWETLPGDAAHAAAEALGALVDLGAVTRTGLQP